jgi:hypothetical protein
MGDLGLLLIPPQEWECRRQLQESGSGGRPGEAIRNIYYSDRQLPPGHDPGADSGEAPHGRQRGLRPLDILVECRGHLRPRLDKPTHRENPRLLASRPMSTGPPFSGQAGSCWSRPARRTRRARRAAAATVTAITAPAVCPCRP